MYIADLHIHSRYSRATSRDCTPEYLDLWAKKKGIHIVGTGDFTHPAWREELEEKLEPEGNGLYRLKKEYCLENQTAGGGEARFVITGEISSIYKKNGRVRKVHSLILLPGLEDAFLVSKKLESIGNIHSDGRPILGLDCRDLLEILLEISPRSIYIPAHIWTPHFSLFGAFSGFDTVEECFEDLTPYIHAMETGLSSDPPMNWRLSMLDSYQLVSNSDAHSPGKLGREANLFQIPLSYDGLYQAIQTGEGLQGTVEFFPEEGKYHLDGHRKCHLCLTPDQTLQYGGKCPVCGKKITIGVANRAQQLADRPEGFIKPGAKPFESLVPLQEVIAASTKRSAASAKVLNQYEDMLKKLGPEFAILREIPIEEIKQASGRLIAQGISRLREGKVERIPGFDGEYGTIQLFAPGEIEKTDGQMDLFGSFGIEMVQAQQVSSEVSQINFSEEEEPESQNNSDGTSGHLANELNPSQQKAVEAVGRAAAVIAGPGTGKTKTLVARILWLLQNRKVKPSEITAVTFTNKAAAEMKERLKGELGSARSLNRMQIGTFHSLCLKLLKDKRPSFAVADQWTKIQLAGEAIEAFSLSCRPDQFLREVSLWKVSGENGREAENIKAMEYYQDNLKKMDYLDYDDLLTETLKLLEEGRDLNQKAFSYLLVDEFQDISPLQLRLILEWNKEGRELFVIGDPDQSIYGFRGADSGCFEALKAIEPGLETIYLKDNYRSAPPIVKAGAAVISHNPGGTRSFTPHRPGEQKIRIVQAAGDLAEAIFAAKEINRMTGGIDMLDAADNIRSREGMEVRSFSEIALLYRTRRQGALLEKCLQKESIPYVVAGQDDFLADPAVQGTLAFFRYLLQKEDLLALEQCRRLLWEPEENALSQIIFQQAVEEFAPKIKGGNPSRLLDTWIERLGKSVHREALEQLRSAALFYKTTAEFLDGMTLGREGDIRRCGGKSYTPDMVTLMTLHASKGLEFPAVIICGVNQKTLPLETEKGESDLEEERRLFLVGMTRAKEEFIHTVYGEPPRLLYEITREFTEKEKAKRGGREGGGKQLSLFELFPAF